MMDEQFRQWLIARGEDGSFFDYSHPLRVQYEYEQQLADQTGGETVAEYFSAFEDGHVYRRTLDNFAFFMLGKNIIQFHQSCNLRRDQSQRIYSDCWSVFDAWDLWVNDVSEVHNS